MTTSADAYTFDFSTSLKNQQPVFTSKQWSYQIDQNNGAYQSKQIIFDLSGFYNSQRFINPQEMFVVFPTVVTLSALPISSTLTPTASISDGLGCPPSIIVAGGFQIPQTGFVGGNNGQVTDQFAVGFKSGFWNLINSVQIQVDGKDIIQLTPYLNYLANFEAITSWSQSDVAKYGPIEGFLPDKCDSFRVNPGRVSNLGIGVCNNLLPGSDALQPYPSSSGSCGLRIGNGTAVSLASSQIWGGFDTPSMGQKAACGPDLTQYTSSSVNDSFYERMRTTNRYYPQNFVSGIPTTGYTQFTPNSLQNTNTSAALQLSLDNYMTSEPMACQTTNGPLVFGPDCSSQTAFRQTFATCVVKFKSFCNLFEKLPLTRGLYMRIIFNMNTGSIVQRTNTTLADPSSPVNAISTVNATHYPYFTSVGTQSTFTNTCPIMIAPMVTSACAETTISSGSAPNITSYIQRGLYPTYSSGTVIADAGVANQAIYPGLAVDSGSFARTGVIVSCAIVNPDPIHKQYAANLAIQSHTLQNCRIYAPIIDMEPDLVTQYITNYKQQAVYYRDSLWFAQIGVAAGAQFNTQVGNGFVNLQRLVIMPFYHDDASSIQFEPTSPFSSAPSTVAPCAELVDFNVLVSNMNMFQRNISYGFENFLEEMGLANAINGGLDTGLTSGLVDYKMWQTAYRYYVVDLSRRLAGDNTPKSVTVIGRNASNYAVDYYYFLQYRRHLTIDIESGHISVSSN
jgi:hypothetical protein